MSIDLQQSLQDKANELADQVIEQKVPEDYKPFARESVSTLNNLYKIRDEFKQPFKPFVPSKEMLNGGMKKPKQTGWQKFKYGLGKLWNVLKAPAQKLINALPFGGMVNKVIEGGSGLVKHFQKK
ncbi:Hypothetical_protein [Hexamita inflata]|uniref:Hypothetical_protein n=1 Tax=Hexamita inflata TaxID=28002 RepID=A0AA86P8T1_9EUKA|nr:Hypothetical protein HINF_LOCUS21756 [Hexamita inflata]CAI9947077.1 Hypothetical protein HINF_LOCUS34722 [Hexamita inflata]CAI9953054.1 Hypothetical protein HINF_LOCUS40699 [Hexamita inflata]CAI9973888.1 Hypothetical protein HINF_LOCUS61533 [Hexamita inflata]